MIRKYLITVDVPAIGINLPENDVQLIIDFDFSKYDTNAQLKKGLLLEIRKEHEMLLYNNAYSTGDVRTPYIIKQWVAVPMYRTYLKEINKAE